MARLTLGEKGQRFKWNLYFFGILLTVGLLTCEVCHRFDWTRVTRGEWEKRFLDLETKVLLDHRPHDQQVYTLAAQCGAWMRERWMAGYLYDEKDGKEYFIGRVSADFRRAVEAQKAAINAGKAFDTAKIPKFQLLLEFPQLKCRLVVGRMEAPNIGKDDR